jgi:hypothetical protein
MVTHILLKNGWAAWAFWGLTKQSGCSTIRMVFWQRHNPDSLAYYRRDYALPTRSCARLSRSNPIMRWRASCSPGF